MLRVDAMELGDRWGWNEDKGPYLTEERAQQSIVIRTESIRRLNRLVEQNLPIPKPLEDRGFTPRKFLSDRSRIAGERLDAFHEKLKGMPLTWRAGGGVNPSDVSWEPAGRCLHIGTVVAVHGSAVRSWTNPPWKQRCP
jgi:hypothetical protein